MNFKDLPLELRVEIANAALKFAELETISFAGARAPVSDVSMDQGEALFSEATEAARALNKLMQRAAAMMAGV